MTKQKQIEEMEKVIKEEQILIANNSNEYKLLMQKGVGYCHAKALYDAGYRKVLFDTENGKAVDVAQYVPWKLIDGYTEIEVEKARKETAREILQTLYDKCYEINDETGESMGNFVIDDDILCLAKHYGVEVK